LLGVHDGVFSKRYPKPKGDLDDFVVAILELGPTPPPRPFGVWSSSCSIGVFCANYDLKGKEDLIILSVGVSNSFMD